MAKIRRLIWDIETSPNIHYHWGCGYNVHLGPESIIQERAIICICYKWERDDDVHSLAWNNGDDKKLVKKFAKIAARADEMIAHNGDRFDMRWYNGRHLIHNLPPMPRSKTVDTLKIARKYFYLNSNKLDYLGKRLFGDRKIKTSYGLWKDVCGRDVKEITAIQCGHGRPEAVDKMIAYCKQDVRLLQRVYDRLSTFDDAATHAGVFESGDVKRRWTCPHCASDNVVKNKTKATTKGMIQHEMKCKECKRYYTIANAVYGMYRKHRLSQQLSDQ